MILEITVLMIIISRNGEEKGMQAPVMLSAKKKKNVKTFIAFQRIFVLFNSCGTKSFLPDAIIS